MAAFSAIGWHRDGRIDAAGPDGETLGTRRRDVLCLVGGQYMGHDDSDTTPPDTSRAAVEAAGAFDLTVECVHDFIRNRDFGVPDSVWSIASAAGVDSTHAVSFRETANAAVTGDFDGDRREDWAVLVEERSTEKLGMVVIHPARRAHFVIAAGTQFGNCPDDLVGMTGWDVFHHEAVNLHIPDRPRAELRGNAIRVTRSDSTVIFYHNVGPLYACELHRAR